MSKNPFPTISSFFVAISIYAIIIVIVFFQLIYFVEPAKRYTDDKDAFIDILIQDKQEQKQDLKSLEKQEKPKDEENKNQDIKKEEPKPIIEEPLPTPIIKTKEQQKQLEAPKEQESNIQISDNAKEINEKEIKQKKPNIKNLFNDIDTSKLKQTEIIKEKKPQNKPSNEASNIIKNLKLDQSSKTQKEQKTGTYDPLLGAITKQIERKWRSYKANTNNVAQIRVNIDKNGNFSYEITKLPYDNEFNSKVKECLEILKSEKFPFSPNGTPITLNLSLEDKLETQ